MKLFGKRKKSSTPSIAPKDGDRSTTTETTIDQKNIKEEDINTSSNTSIPSYFSNDFKPPSKVDDEQEKKSKNNNNNVDIDYLLSLDPKSLNSKQRRLIRRHHERMKDGMSGGEGLVQKGKDGKEANNDEDTPIVKEQSNEKEIKAETKPQDVQSSNGKNNEVVENNSDSDSSSSSSSDSDSDSSDDDDDNSPQNDSKSNIIKKDVDDNEKKKAMDTKQDKDITNTTTTAIKNEESKDGQNKQQNESKNKSTTTKQEEQSKDNKDESNPTTVSEILEKLQTLNSKERRKLLRKLENENQLDLVQKVKEESKRIASENEKLEKEKQEMAILEQKKKKELKKRKMEEEDRDEDNDNEKDEDTQMKEDDNTSEMETKEVSNENSVDNSTTRPKKKRKWKDFSHLPPEERERREKQRLMQMEAAARRANGEVDTTRHPLNSERRRANRRKPGRMGKILQMKKDLKDKQQNLKIFNASGFHMRKAKRGDQS